MVEAWDQQASHRYHHVIKRRTTRIKLRDAGLLTEIYIATDYEYLSRLT